jgi:ubiquinone/menaquinone biosynthesis C-methylase UbiE
MNSKEVLKKIYLAFYGVPDLHTHIRFRAIKKYVEYNRKNVLEVGCGSGIMISNLAKKFSADSYLIGIDSDLNAIKYANQDNKFKNLKFMVGNVLNLNFPDGEFDEILCFDILEHVRDDAKAVSEISRVLKEDGVLIVSAPTPLYPKYFGRKFADAIGHVRDGYTLDQLIGLLAKYKFKILSFEYYTLTVSALICYLYYVLLFNKPILQVIFSPILNLFTYLDIFCSSKSACSIILKAIKTT